MREKKRSNIDKRERKTKTIFQQIEQHCKSMYSAHEKIKQIQMKRNRKQNVYMICVKNNNNNY